MKTIITRLLPTILIILSAKCFAQTPDTSTVEKLLHYIVQPLNKSQVPTGFLEEYGCPITSLSTYNGVLSASNKVDIEVWRTLYFQLQTSYCQSGTNPLPPITTINSAINQASTSNSVIPIPLLIGQYNTVKSDAFTNNLLTYNSMTNQVADVITRTQSPYSLNQLFTGSPVKNYSLTGKDTFIISSNLIWNNTNKSVLQIQIDFDNGQGFKTVAIGTPIAVSYQDTGLKRWTTKIQLSDNSWLQSYVQFYVAKIIGNELSRYDFVNFDAQIPFPSTANHAGGNAFIRYSRKNPTYQLRKPLLVVEGYDTRINRNDPLTNYNYSDFIQGINAPANFDFNGHLDDGYTEGIANKPGAGYDIIFLDFTNGRDDITRNAALVEEVITWINAHKTPNNNNGGIMEQNVVMGISMGGLVARYALAHMTKTLGSASPQTRLLISHDSPHKGANVPLGLQYLLRMTGEANLFGYNVRDIYPNYDAAINLLSDPATPQLLLYTSTGSNSYSANTFLEGDYKNMVTFFSNGPQPTYRFIATSLGNECAHPVFSPHSLLVYSDIQGFLNLLLITYKLHINARAYSLPSLGGTDEIAHFELSSKWKLFGFITISKNVYNNTAYASGSQLPVDGVPGAQNPAYKAIPNFAVDVDLRILDVSVIIVGQPTQFTFIPTASALDVTPYDNSALQQKYVGGLNGSYPSSSATYIAQETVQGNAAQTNNAHIRFTARNTHWMFNEMEGLANDQNCSSECSPSVSNFSMNGVNPLCTSSSFNVNNISTNAVVNWSANPSYIVNLNPNGSQVTVTPRQFGDVTLTAQLSNGCASTPVSVSKTIHVGNPPYPAISASGFVKQFSPGVWKGMVELVSTIPTFYQWSIDGSILTSSTGRKAEFPVPSGVGMNPFYQDYKVEAKATNACGTSQDCAVFRYKCNANTNQRTLTYLKSCAINVEKHVPNRFILSKDLTTAQHLQIDVASQSDDQYAQLFPDPETLANEMIQQVSVYDLEGNIVQEVGGVAAKTTSIDISTLPEGSYNVVVAGNSEYVEQQTFKLTITKTEQELAEEIATDNYTIPDPDEAARKEVLKQQLFKELLAKDSLVNASAILQNFMATKDQENYGFIQKITNAFDNGDTATVQILLNQWVPQNDQDQNCIDYFNLYLRLLANDTFSYTDISDMYDLANKCPLKDGEIIYAARSLYNFMTESSETFDYACDGTASRATNRAAMNAQAVTIKTRHLPTNIKVYPNPSKGSFNLDFPATEKGNNIITLNDVYGKQVLQKTVTQRLNNITLPTGTATGIYMLHITNLKTGKQQTQKIVVKS